MDKFTEYNAGNLMTHNVRHVSGMPYVLVHRSHPVMSFITDNASHLMINPVDIGQHEWTKVSYRLLESCCVTLCAHVFPPI